MSVKRISNPKITFNSVIASTIIIGFLYLMILFVSTNNLLGLSFSVFIFNLRNVNNVGFLSDKIPSVLLSRVWYP